MARQGGVALISVLLVVAIATVLAVAMAREQRQAILGLTNFFSQSQARQYALGGEELARQILQTDYTDSPASDHLNEGWAAGDLLFEFADGEVSLQIDDLQGRINLNNLLGSEDDVRASKARLQRLAEQLGLAAGIADKVRDFADQDQQTTALGAEDYVYLGLERPYRTSGRPFVDLTELRLLEALDAQSYALLAPHVCVLPAANMTINVNTASAEVLQSLATNMTPQIAEAIISQRQSQGAYESVQQFLQAPELAGLGLSETGLGVQSEFFEVRIRARFQNRYAYLTSVIQRDTGSGRMRVIYRNTSKKILPVVTTDTQDQDDV